MQYSEFTRRNERLYQKIINYKCKFNFNLHRKYDSLHNKILRKLNANVLLRIHTVETFTTR